MSKDFVQGSDFVTETSSPRDAAVVDASHPRFGGLTATAIDIAAGSSVIESNQGALQAAFDYASGDPVYIPPALLADGSFGCFESWPIRYPIPRSRRSADQCPVHRSSSISQLHSASQPMCRC